MQRFDDGVVIFAAGQPLPGVFEVQRGAVQVWQSNADGAALVVKLLGPGAFFGSIEALGDEDTALESVSALGDVVVERHELAAFRALVAADHAMCLRVLKDTARAFCGVARFEPAHLASLEQRLAALLLAWRVVVGEHDGANGCRLRVKRSQAALAEAVGATERGVHKVLTSLGERGLVDRHEGRLRLLDVAALQAIAGGLERGLVHTGL